MKDPGAKFLLLAAFGFLGLPSSAQTGNDPLVAVTTFLNAVKDGRGSDALPLVDSLVQWQQPGDNRLSGLKKQDGGAWIVQGV